MIEISLYTALALYGALLIAGAMGIWVYTERTARRVHRILGSQHVWRCSYCAYTYLDETAVEMSTCPRCGSINRIDDVGVKPYEVEAVRVNRHREDGARNTSKSKSKGMRSRGPRRRR